VLLAIAAGIYLARRSFLGRYRVSYFAGICPRCGQPISLGLDRCISLPHTLTCYSCHFEPTLEVRFVTPERQSEARPEHADPACVGRWEARWLADEQVIVCNRCRASCPATPAATIASVEENERADLLDQLTREGRLIL
jgi:hypothetical protein